MTYTEAYNKIIDAYFKDEIRPMDMNFCFCGTLEGSGLWHWEPKAYTMREFKKLEFALLNPLNGIYTKLFYATENDGATKSGFHWTWFDKQDPPNTKEYEDALFKGMCAALDVLKSIHESRGEIINEQPVFMKREFVV